MSTVKRKTWNPREYFRQLLIVAGTLTECLLEVPEKFCSRTRWRVTPAKAMRRSDLACAR